MINYCVNLFRLFLIWMPAEWKVDGGVIWADDCHFRGQDIPKTPTKNTKKEDCGKLCSNNPECDHFTWNNIGECWLKKWSGKGPTAAVSFRCGFIPSRATANANALGATVAGLVATVTHMQSHLKGQLLFHPLECQRT